MKKRIPKYRRRTPEQLIDELRAKPDPIHAINKTAMTRYMNQFDRYEKREVRRIAKERMLAARFESDFYGILHRQVGNYRVRSVNDDTEDRRRRKRISRLPYSFETKGGTGSWTFVDATRGILLPRDTMLIPSIHKTRNNRHYLDIRIWMHRETEKGVVVRATRKGCCISIDRLDELRGLLEALSVRWKRQSKNNGLLHASVKADKTNGGKDGHQEPV